MKAEARAAPSWARRQGLHSEIDREGAETFGNVKVGLFRAGRTPGEVLPRGFALHAVQGERQARAGDQRRRQLRRREPRFDQRGVARSVAAGFYFQLTRPSRKLRLGRAIDFEIEEMPERAELDLVVMRAARG